MLKGEVTALESPFVLLPSSLHGQLQILSSGAQPVMKGDLIAVTISL